MATPPDARPFFSSASVAVRCASTTFVGLFFLSIGLAAVGLGLTQWSFAAGYLALCLVLFFLITGQESIPAPAMVWIFLSDTVDLPTKVAAAAALIATLTGLYLLSTTLMLLIVATIVADGLIRILQGRDAEDPEDEDGMAA